jgi:hypothetical protein
MNSLSRIQTVFAALAALIVVALAVAYLTGAFGVVVWRAIDLVRLGAEAGFLVAGVVAFGRIGSRAFPVPMVIYAFSVFTQAPLITHTDNLLLQAAGCAVVVMAITMMATGVVVRRRARASVPA